MSEVTDMICNNCGKENADGNKFCVYCGHDFEKTQTENVNMAQGANVKQNASSTDFVAVEHSKNISNLETQEYLERQKAENIIRGTLKREKASSVIWLISGILQCLMFVIFMCQSTFSAVLNIHYFSEYDNGSFGNFIGYMPFPLIIILRFAILITAVVGIKLFLKRKSEKQIVNLPQKTAILMLVSQVVIWIIVAIWDKLPHCSVGYIYSSIEYFTAEFVDTVANKIGIWIMRKGININAAFHFFKAALILIFALPVVSSLLEVINAVVVKKNKAVFEEETDNAGKIRRTPLRCISAVICVFVAVSSVYLFADATFAKIRSNDEEHLKSEIEYGHLYNFETSIDDAINAIAEKICKTETNYKPTFTYDNMDPYEISTYNKYLRMYFPLTKEQKRIRYMRVSINGEASDVSMTFRVDTDNDTIDLFSLDINSKKIDEEEKGKFIAEYFSDASEELYDDGEYYMEYGKYISNDQRLYSLPEYGTASEYTYKKSGTKDVYDYEVKGGILWLKVSVMVDDDEEFYWVPVSD